MLSFTTRLRGTEFKILRLQESPLDLTVLDAPDRTAAYLRLHLPGSLRYNQDTENLIVVLLNTRRRAIGFEVVSNGTLDTILVHPREVFKPAIILGASALILAHNHPSGDPTPSEADIKVTRDMIRAGQLLKIDVLDHIILGAGPEFATTGSAAESVLVHPGCATPKSHVSLREMGYFNF